MIQGRVASVFRYPVKSVQGESVQRGTFDERGLHGDRAFAFVDRETGKLASAKQPKLWRELLAVQAENDASGHVRLRFPDGQSFGVADPALESTMSGYLGRGVRLVDAPLAQSTIERVTPEGEEGAGTSVELPVAGAAPAGTLFDYAPVHLLSTASLHALEAHHPERQPSQALRFRPNLVLEVDGVAGFVESEWTDCTLSIGAVQFRILSATPRCAVPTLRHGASIPEDRQLIRTLGRVNRVPVPGFGNLSCLGAYASVLVGGTVCVGDRFEVNLGSPAVASA